MWLLILAFGLMTLIIGWTLLGYFILIWFMGLFREERQPELPDSWPFLSVIVPCLNEEKYILDKLKNLQECDYPQDRMELIFADGGSTDQTVELLSKAIKPDSIFRILKCKRAGKINQLNETLPELKGEIIICTDADTLIAKDALQWTVAEFKASSDVQVIGAYCRQDDTAMVIDQYYWDSQNKGRFMESALGNTSIVIGAFYAFHHDFIKEFPDDVIADDVYVAQHAFLKGFKAIYSRHVQVVEMRNPKGYSEYFPHKFIKSNAVLRDSLRFIYRISEMSGLQQIQLLTRIAQQIVMPWAIIGWAMLAGVLLTLPPPAQRIDIVLFASGFLFLLLLFCNRIFNTVKLPDEKRKYSIFTVVKGYSCIMLILLVTGISYPFYKR